MRASDLKNNYCNYIYNQPNEWGTGCNQTYDNWHINVKDEYKLYINTCPFCNKPIKEIMKYNPCYNYKDDF